jgi:glycerophosphoryl diester phosphodiesterase
MLLILALMCAVVRADEPSLPAKVDTAKEVKKVELNADFTIEWWQYVGANAVTKPRKLASLGKLIVATNALPKAKEKDPPRAVFEVVNMPPSQSRAYPNKWYHLAGVRKGESFTLYVNGQPEPVSAPLLGPVGGDVSGDINGLTVTDKALSSAEVFEHFRAPLPELHITTSGHRGLNKSAPENTNISYVESIAGHIPVVEMDLRLTKDNVLILMHDATVDRTTNGKGKVLDLTLDEIRKLDAGTWKDKKYAGEKVPLVEEIAQTCRGKAIMMLDLKCTGLGKSLAELKQKLNYPSEEWILAPWEDEEGTELRKYLSDVPMVRLTSTVPDVHDDAYFAKMKQIGFSGFSVNWMNLPQDFIHAAHRNGMKVWVWTINEPVEICGAALAGVDGIVTDDGISTMKVIDSLTKR